MEVLIDLEKRYTITDYLSWTDDRVKGLIDGVVKLMSPSANLRHQDISLNLSAWIKQIFKERKCPYKVCQDVDVIFDEDI